MCVEPMKKSCWRKMNEKPSSYLKSVISSIFRENGVGHEFLSLEAMEEYYFLAMDRPGYHGIRHIENLFILFEKYEKKFAHNPSALKFAIAFHDIVCIPGSKDNEMLTVGNLTKFMKFPKDNEFFDYIADIITMSPNPMKIRGVDETEEQDILFFHDLDYSILGAPALPYLQYAMTLWQEYSFAGFSFANYREGRIKFLENLLKMGEVFCLQKFRDMYNAQMKLNISKELEFLNGQW